MPKRPLFWGQRSYVGYRYPDGRARIFVRQASGHLSLLLHHVLHSPTGFEWGYGGSGPADAARCILINVAGGAVADRLYQDFKDEFVSGLPRGLDEVGNPPVGARVLCWIIEEREIIEWIDERLPGQLQRDTPARPRCQAITTKGLPCRRNAFYVTRRGKALKVVCAAHSAWVGPYVEGEYAASSLPDDLAAMFDYEEDPDREVSGVK